MYLLVCECSSHKRIKHEKVADHGASQKMSIFPKKVNIPEHYRKQSEKSDWLPGVEALEDEYGDALFQELYKMGNGRINRLFLDAFLFIFTCTIATAAFLTVQDQFQIFPFILLFIFTSLSMYLLHRVWFVGLFGNEEPNLEAYYLGEKPEQYNEFIQYWTWLKKTDQPILASVGNNEVGRPISLKTREYGFLSVMGNH